MVFAPPLSPVMLPAGESPLDNPLKGYASYTEWPVDAPVSMGYFYATWKDLEPEEGRYDWAKLESRWDSGAVKGKHVVLRLYLEYPGKPSGVPDWVPSKGTPYPEFGGGLSPDYADPKLLDPLLRFIAAFGARYDGNPRVAFVALGTLGHWGEWHTWPSVALFPSDEVQQKVVDAYHQAFPHVPLMARYPTNPATQTAWLGYHDDLFPVDTLAGPGSMWRFMPALESAGRTDNWKVAPIGGEMEPKKGEKWLGEGWDQTLKAAREGHFSWIGPYSPALAVGMRPRAEELIRALGYDFRLRRLDERPDGDGWRVTVQGVNQGVAPFYRAWPIQLSALDGSGTWTSDADIRTWLPGPFKASFHLPARPEGRLGFGIIDPWTGKPAISFANDLPKEGEWTLVRGAEEGRTGG